MVIADVARRLSTALLGGVLVGGVSMTGAAAQPVPAEPPARVLRVQAGRMAEPVVAVDPRDPDHIAVAADPYLNPTRIQVATSRDGGRTWSRRVDLVPPGYRRSYDPKLTFLPDGTLLVAGGAAKGTKPFCLPDSAVFLARLTAEQPTYEIVARAGKNAFLDRPSVLYDASTRSTMLSWTRATGPGVWCQAVASHATTRIAWRKGDGAFQTEELATIAPAVYGSYLTTAGPGRVAIAVGGWYPSRRQRVGVTLFDLRTGATDQLPTLPAAKRPPLKLAEPAPLNLAEPSIAVRDGTDLVVAWTERAKGQIRVRVATSDGSTWHETAGPPGTGVPMVPTLMHAPDGNLLLLEARVRAGTLSYTLWQRDGSDWERVRDLGKTSAGRYTEIGQLLGLARSGSTVVTAVPLGGSKRSWLSVRVHRWPTPTSPTSSPSTSPSDGGSAHRSARDPARWPFHLWLVLALSVSAGAAALVFRRRRAR